MNANETKKLNTETAEAELNEKQLEDVTGGEIRSSNIVGYGLSALESYGSHTL